MKLSKIIKFFLLILPLLEIAVFIWVGQLIGVGWTLLLVLVSTVLGIALIRNQGLQMMREFSQKARSGHAEPADLMNGSFIFIGGFLLIIPGFITDVIGLLCFIPFIRRGIIKWVILAIAKPVRPATSHYRVIEGKFTDETKQP